MVVISNGLLVMLFFAFFILGVVAGQISSLLFARYFFTSRALLFGERLFGVEIVKKRGKIAKGVKKKRRS